MKNKIKVGIIGTGSISEFHVAGYKKLIDVCEVEAVCDIDKVKVENFAKKHGIKNSYTDYNEMLANHKLDGVSVCTWNSVHMDASIAALEKKMGVLCEKPMAINANEAIKMQEVAKKNNSLLMIGFVRRFGNDTEIAKDFIDKGNLGDIYYAKAKYLRRSGSPGGWFKDKRYSGGGPLIDLSVHVVDLVKYLANNPKPISAYGVTYSNLGPNRAKGASGYLVEDGDQYQFNVEDLALAMIKFDNGMTLFVETSFNLNIKKDENSIELFGTKGGLKISPDVELYTELADRFVDVSCHGASALSFTGLFEREIAHFVDCLRGETSCISTGQDGLEIMKIIDAVYESARTNKEILIK